MNRRFPDEKRIDKPVLTEAPKDFAPLDKMEVSPETPWFNVETNPPGERCQVLCYGEGGYVIRIYSRGDWFNEYGASTMNVMGEVEDIELWTYLPPLPKPTRNPAAGVNDV